VIAAPTAPAGAGPRLLRYGAGMRRVGAIACVGVLFVACGQVKNQPDAGPTDSSTEQDVAADALGWIDADAGNAPEASTDAGAEAEAAVDAGACGPYESTGPYGCNKLLPPATSIPLTCVSEPAATGGTIVDGYYELTGYAFDTNTFDASCPSGASRRGIVMFCAGTMLWFDIDQNNSSFDSTGTYTTSGNTITISPLSNCSGNEDTYEYTATATTFEIRGGSPITQVYTYTMK
jgi:hypothetical protein